MKTAKIFRSGNNQAVRIPKEFQMEGDEVEISNTTSNSSSSGGCSMTMWNMKRSSCASGSG